jgi:hypothetical protein
MYELFEEAIFLVVKAIILFLVLSFLGIVFSLTHS